MLKKCHLSIKPGGFNIEFDFAGFSQQNVGLDPRFSLRTWRWPRNIWHMNPRDEDLESWHKPKPVGVEFEATKTYKTYKKNIQKKLWFDHPKIVFWPTQGWNFQQNKSSIGILGRTGEWGFVMIPIARSLAWTAPIDSTAATDVTKWTSIKSGIALKPKTDWLVRP